MHSENCLLPMCVSCDFIVQSSKQDHFFHFQDPRWAHFYLSIVYIVVAPFDVVSSQALHISCNIQRILRELNNNVEVAKDEKEKKFHYLLRLHLSTVSLCCLYCLLSSLLYHKHKTIRGWMCRDNKSNCEEGTKSSESYYILHRMNLKYAHIFV